MAKNQTIRHKRSTVAGNRPSTAQVEVGELAINIADRSIYTQTSSGTIIELAADVFTGTAYLGTPNSGDTWYNTTTGAWSVWDGTQWVNTSFSGRPVLPANTTALNSFSGGSGTSASPYTYSTTTPGGTTIIANVITITGLNPGQFVPAVDLNASSNGGRFSVANNFADDSGTLVFSIVFDDIPTSAGGTTYTSKFKIGTGTVYIDVSVAIANLFPQSVNFPTGISSASTSWTSANDTLASTGSLRISTNGSTFSTGPLAITTGATLYTAWTGSAGSGIGIDSAHGTTITGSVVSSATSASSSSSLVVDKTPVAFAFTSQTGVGLSTVVTSNTITIGGVNSYVYLTSPNTITASLSGASFVSVPASGTSQFVVSGQTIAIRQTSSAVNNTTVIATLAAGGTSATFSVATGTNIVNTPTITSPVTGSTGISASLTITSSAYAITGIVGTHLNTDWEIHSNSSMTALVTSSMASTTNLTSWTPTGLAGNTQYWARVRYRSDTAVVSSWSPVVEFTTIGSFIAVSHATSPYISAYTWSDTGFGPKVADPATIPSGTGFRVAFSPSGSHLAVGHNTSPFISVYPWSGTGFGPKMTNPTTLPDGQVIGIAFSPSGDHIAISFNTLVEPYILVYPWSDAGFGDRISDPSIQPSLATDVAFSPSGSHIAVAHSTAPRISVYPWSAAGFGFKVANPAVVPTGAGRTVAFSPSGSHLAVGHNTSPFISVYSWTGTSFGHKIADPSTLPPNEPKDIAFSPSGSHLAVGHYDSPYISVYPWSGAGFGARVSDPSTQPFLGNGVAFSPSGSHIAVAHADFPYINVYGWSGTGFGPKMTNPTTLPTGMGNGVAFSPS